MSGVPSKKGRVAVLHKETVEKATFELLANLMQDKQLKAFYLAGGTNLSLQIGHRKSVDLDLFSTVSIDVPMLQYHLERKYAFSTLRTATNTLIGEIDGIKVDCIGYDYPLVEPIVEKDGIRLYDIKDISAMKLNAIADSGTRLKDFVDIAFLSSHITFKEMLEAYEIKYPNSTSLRPLRGLCFFQDIDFQQPIMLMSENYKWEIIEERLHNMLDDPHRLFSPLSFSTIHSHRKKKGRQI